MAAEPHQTPADDIAIHWRRFLDDIPPDGAVRDVILESWRRSRDAGVAPRTAHVVLRRVPDAELAARTAANAELIEVARPHLEWLSAAHATIPHVVYLADRDGIVLASTGTDPEAMIALGLEPGHDWSEAAAGTNGAGTAIVSRAAVTVAGAEHFVEALHGYTCSGAPLRDPDGTVVGAIDLSTAREDATPECLTTIAHAAWSIAQEVRWRAALRERDRRLADGEQATRDAADHLAALEALRESEARFAGAFEHSIIAAAITHPSGRWLRVNRALCTMLGYTEQELLGRPFQSITPDDDLEPNLVLLRRVIAGEIDSYTMRKGLVHKNGHVVQVHLSATAVRDSAGAVRYLVAQFQDVSAEVETQRRLAEEEARYAHIAAHVPGVVYQYVFRADGTHGYTVVSDGARALFGIEPADALANDRLLLDLIHPEDRPRFTQLALAAAGAASSFSWEGRVVPRSGRELFVRVVAQDRREPDGTIVSDGFIMDLTRQRELEAQLAQAQKMEAVGRLAGGVAHDFNNLLTVISSYTAMALDALPQDLPVRDDLYEVQTAAGRAAALTGQLLAFSRQQVLRPRRVDINRAVDALSAMLRRLIGEDVALRTELAADLLPVHADPGQLEQVVMNLAVNARDAMPHGGTLTIRTANVVVDPSADGPLARVEPGRYAALRVEDSGTGIAPDVLPRIFEPFFTTKAVGHGTGLGLPMVYGIVVQSGGHVHVDTVPGEGTAFTVLLPVFDGAEREPEEAPAPRPRGGTETILLVEDEPAVRSVARRMLARLGYTVVEAASGDEAVRMAAELHAGGAAVDLVLTDLVMPGGSGRSLGEELARRWPGVRMLYMSGYTDDEIFRRELIPAGAPFLSKPFTEEGLARAVRRALG